MKRVLMVAFHFPPLAGSSGIQRSLRFVQHLPESGWQPLVLTAHPRAYERTSDDLGDDVPVGTVVRRAFALDTARHLSVGGRYVGAMARPDRWMSWRFDAVRQGLRMIDEYRPDAIWTTYPIATAHVIGAALHARTGLPWIADFRDPWTWRDRHGYNWSADRRGAAATERAVLRHASALTTIGQSLGEELAERAGREVVVLPHGIPLERVDVEPRTDERLELVHAGTANEPFADLTPIARALLRLHELDMPARLTLFGPVEYRPSELDHAEALGLVEVKGNVSRQDAQRAAASADVALLVRKHPSTIWVTTKLWDYLAARTPVLVVANPECDAAKIVRETRSGWTVPYDEDAVVAALAQAYERRRAGESLWTPDEEALARYDAKAISRRFIELLLALR